MVNLSITAAELNVYPDGDAALLGTGLVFFLLPLIWLEAKRGVTSDGLSAAGATKPKTDREPQMDAAPQSRSQT
jgi:hypothetical protein